MNTKIRDIASLVFEKIYYLLTYSVIYVIALLMGLGFLTFAGGNISVSYTHLTLPTSELV